jgi:hypothetical protein
MYLLPLSSPSAPLCGADCGVDNAVGVGDYNACPTGPGRMILVHADPINDPVLPAGVTLVCSSRLTLMSDKAGSSPAPVNGSTMLVTSPVIGSGAYQQPGMCSQDPGGSPNGCGALGNVAFPVPSSFNCQPWLYWEVVSCVAVTVRAALQMDCCEKGSTKQVKLCSAIDTDTDTDCTGQQASRWHAMEEKP